MRVNWLGALLLAAAALLGPGTNAQAQDYPNRPVRSIIAFSPAGAIDVLGRLIADKLSTHVGPAGDRREPPGRRRQYRRGRGGAGRARRLHAAFRRADARHQRDARAEHRVPSGDELRADHAGRHGAGDFHGGERHAVQVGERGDRLRQGQSRQAELRLGRHRHQRASGDGAVQRSDRREDAARALQPDVADLCRHLLRPHRDLVHHRGRLAAAYPIGQGEGARGQRARRARSSCPSCRP